MLALGVVKNPKPKTKTKTNDLPTNPTFCCLPTRNCPYLRSLRLERYLRGGCLVTDRTLEVVATHAPRLVDFATRNCCRFSATGLARLLVAALPASLCVVTVTYGPGHAIRSADDVSAAVAEVTAENKDRKAAFALSVQDLVRNEVVVRCTRFRSNE